MNKRYPLLFPFAFSGLFMAANAGERVNVVFILVDDLGKEWIQRYGAENIELPNIQSLSEDGILFDRAYSMPQSTPSRAALLTGQYPYRNGWINHYDVPRWGNGAHFDFSMNPCFPRQIRKNGYKTCAAGKWQLNDFRLQPDAMERAGFDEYCMWTGAEGGNEKISGSRYWNPYIHTKEGSKVHKGAFGPDVYSNFIIDFIVRNKDNPFFVYYPMTLTHTPFVHTPHAMSAKTNYEKHKAMVEYTDFIVGKIISCLKENGLYDSTYVFLSTDNGTTGKCIGVRNGNYIRGGKSLLSENGINCPLIVHVPGGNVQERSDVLIDFTDIYPTLLDITDSKGESGYEIDGISFASVLRGDKKISPRKFALSMGGLSSWTDENGMVRNQVTFRDRVIISGKYKIYLDNTKQIERIFDLTSDPYECNNLFGDRTLLEKIKKEFAEIMRQIPNKDNDPIYKQLPYKKENSVRMKRSSNCKSGFCPLGTKVLYDEFVNNKK